MERAFGVLEFRAVDEEQRIIEGVATTMEVDSYGTILESAGARYSLPLPLFWMHRQDTPVGEVVAATVHGDRISIRAKFFRIDDPGTLKNDIDRAWHAVKIGAAKGLSVGFAPISQKGNRFVEWLWKELSIVTLASTPGASILAVRSAYLAASGDQSPGVSGTNSNSKPRRPMTILEQITQHENTRAAKVARQTALMEGAAAEGRTLEANESEEYDTLAGEVESIDGHLRRLNQLKTANEANLRPVNGGGSAAATATRAAQKPGTSVRVKTNEEPGLGYARYAMALLSCKGNRYEAAEYAKRTWGEQGDGVALMLRAAVAAGTTTTSGWAAELVQTNYLNEFIELLRPRTIIGRIPGIRSVPFNVSMPSQTAGGSYSWVGQGAAKPVTRPTFGTVTLGMAKAAGIIVLTEELVRSSTPSAQEAVREEMIAGIGQYLSNQFVDPAVAAVNNVSPASITNGVSATEPSGTTEANYRDDLNALVGTFAGANFPLGGVVLLMSEARAWTVGGLVNALGQPAFPGVGVEGGSVRGIQIVASNAAALADLIVAAHAPSILVADEGQVEIDVSREASIQMDDSPANPTAADTVLVSLWQRNLVGMRAERFINWGKSRTGAVAVLDYGLLS